MLNKPNQELYIFINLYKYHKELEKESHCMFFDESEQKNNIPCDFLPIDSEEFGFSLESQPVLSDQKNQDATKYKQTEKRDFTETINQKIYHQKSLLKKKSLSLQNFDKIQVEQLLNLQSTKDKHESPEGKISQNHFSEQNLVFRECHPKQQQKSNKNFIKFFLAKIFIQFRQLQPQNVQWHKFYLNIEQKYQRNTTLKALQQLFGSQVDQNLKTFTRKMTQLVLKDYKFYKDYFYNSNYIKSKQNRKQYLLASKIYSLRSRSAQLMCRVQTK